MGCSFLNENIHHTILDYLENKSENYQNKEFLTCAPKARYSPVTLINDWYEDRLQNLPSSSDLPSITEYQDNYRSLCKYSLPDKKDYFKLIFDNQGLGQEILMDHHGKSYYNNFSTTYDLCYSHLNKGLCGPFPRTYIKGRYMPETDLTSIYGNITQRGIKKKSIQTPQIGCNPVIPMAEYATEYIPHNRVEVKRLNDFPFQGRKKSDLLVQKR